MAYVLGVDGGNTKTDYLLHGMDGALVAHVKGGTCSHEALGMAGAHREMDARIAELAARAGIQREEIAAAAFGLAGIDQPLQQADLLDIIHKMGFANSIAMNDSFLGIKAGSETGTGVCSINGTGTAAGGIDADGNWMQVGGFGLISGDEAGGSHIAVCTLRAVYDEIFRFGTKTALTPVVLKLFACEKPDDFHTEVSTRYMYGRDVTALDVINVLFAASTEGDPVARGIVEAVAQTLARSAAGCAVRLRFGAEIPVVLIGSVWTKGRHGPMVEYFQQRFEVLTGKKSTLHILEVPPAAGSVLWALELAMGKVPDGKLRERVFADTKGM